MVDHKYYVPILKWKRGERIALQELYDVDREGIIPLIEISQKFVEKAPHFFDTGKFIPIMLEEIASCWGDSLAFVDLYPLARLPSANVARHIETFFYYSAEVGLNLCPVVRAQMLDSCGQATYKAAHACQTMCLRLHVKDFEDLCSSSHGSAVGKR
jgi:hypothetical protein